MSCLYWLIYFKWLYVGNVKIPHVLTEWRGRSSLVVLQCTSTLNSREWKSLHLIFYPFLHTAAVRVRKIPEQMPRHWVLRLVRHTDWSASLFQRALLSAYFKNAHHRVLVLTLSVIACLNCHSSVNWLCVTYSDHKNWVTLTYLFSVCCRKIRHVNRVTVLNPN